MVLRRPAVLALSSVLVLVPGAAQAAADVPDAPVGLRIVQSTGSGCAGATLAGGVDGFTLTYPDFRARGGPGSAPTDFRKSCQVAVEVTAPAGWTYAFAATAQAGTAATVEDADARYRNWIYTAGSSTAAPTTTQLRGPAQGAWSVRAEIDPAARVFAWCGGTRQWWNVNDDVLLQFRTPAAKAVPTSVTLTGGDYRFVWRRCPTPS